MQLALETLGKLDNVLLAQSLKQAAAPVREVALEIAESRLAVAPELLASILALADDRDPRVRFQCAIACGASNDPRVVPAIARISLRDSGDRWLRAAVFSSIAGREAAFLEELLGQVKRAAAGGTDLYSELGRLLGASQSQESWPKLVHRIVEIPADEFEIPASLLTGLADALRNKGVARDHGAVLAAVVAAGKETSSADAKALAALFSAALRFAGDSNQPVARRQIALALLAHSDFALVGKQLLALVDTQQPAVVQSGAVRALGAMTDPAIAEALLAEERFAAYTPMLREEVLSAMLASPQHLSGVLTALESGAVSPNVIDSLRRKRLTENRDPAIRERAAKLYAVGQPGDRAKVYEEYKIVLNLTPEPENGRAVFKKTCAVCHRLDREGTTVGPDLFGIRNQPKEAILLHILIPEAEITPGFAAYVLETKAGQVLTGLVASETATSVTLRQQLGKEETVLRSDIESLVSSKLSLMPQSIEKSLSRQDLADLVAYLKGEQKAK